MTSHRLVRGVLTCWIAATIVSAAPAAADKPNFSGTWLVDQARSTSQTTPRPNADPKAPLPPPPPPPPPPGKTSPPHIVTHNDPVLTIQEGPGSYTLRLTTDGKENVNRQSNDRTHRSTSRWEGDKLVTQWTLEDNGERLAQGTDTRSLTENGAVMIDDRTIKWPRLETSVHLVLKRRP